MNEIRVIFISRQVEVTNFDLLTISLLSHINDKLSSSIVG